MTRRTPADLDELDLAILAAMHAAPKAGVFPIMR